MTTATEFAPGLAIQGFTAPLSLSQFKLIAFDMDSTLISIECIDEIADAVGRKAEVAAITEAAMRGEITDFKESLRRRLALLKGVTLADMERLFDGIAIVVLLFVGLVGAGLALALSESLRKKVLDALVDLVYVALGTAYLHGFGPQKFNEAWRRVHEKNMEKIRAPSADHSKRGSAFDVIKPAGWTPP